MCSLSSHPVLFKVVYSQLLTHRVSINNVKIFLVGLDSLNFEVRWCQSRGKFSNILGISKQMDSSRTSHIKEAQSTLATIQEISQLLNTGLGPEALTICVRLCEVGVNPEVLASLVRDLQQEVREYHSQLQSKSNSSKNVRSDHNTQ